MENKLWFIVFSVIVAVALVVVGYVFLKSEETPAAVKEQIKEENLAANDGKKENSAPTFSINVDKIYRAVLRTTKGDITIDLSVKSTPITVNNFVYLARKDFYNDTVFHRVIKGFMIQGGDPAGDGTGGPGYKFADEPFDGEYTRGTVAMANAGPNTNGSQFFIMHADYPLPKNYVIFGRVVGGIDVVDAIAESEVVKGSTGELSRPVNFTAIVGVDIQER